MPHEMKPVESYDELPEHMQMMIYLHMIAEEIFDVAEEIFDNGNDARLDDLVSRFEANAPEAMRNVPEMGAIVSAQLVFLKAAKQFRDASRALTAVNFRPNTRGPAH